MYHEMVFIFVGLHQIMYTDLAGTCFDTHAILECVTERQHKQYELSHVWLVAIPVSVMQTLRYAAQQYLTFYCLSPSSC